MVIPEETLETYLPAIEEFLTSLMMEEANIEVDEFEEVNKDASLEQSDDTNIFLYTREQTQSSDVIVVLDKEWFGLLSGIMLGIDEKEKNDQTVELLKDFAGDLSDAIIEEARNNDLEIELGKVDVLEKDEAREKLAHISYVRSELAIKGIADKVVKAGFLIGDPDVEIVHEDEGEEDKEIFETGDKTELDELKSKEDEGKQENKEDESDSPSQSAESEPEQEKEDVISLRSIEFPDFSEENSNGDGRIMDLLKEVELNVSVELGRKELPLGKILELSKGSIIELEELAGEPVDLLVNGNLIARGEVVVIDEHFGVRITSLLTTKKSLVEMKNLS